MEPSSAHFSGRQTRLNDLLVDRSDWNVIEAVATNDDGLIVGRAQSGGAGGLRAVLLTPIGVESGAVRCSAADERASGVFAGRPGGGLARRRAVHSMIGAIRRYQAVGSDGTLGSQAQGARSNGGSGDGGQSARGTAGEQRLFATLKLFVSSDGKLVMVCKYTETGVVVDCLVTLK